MKQHHTIEIFSANCPLCKHITDVIEIGKCEGCNQIIYNFNEMTNDLKKMENEILYNDNIVLASELILETS